MGELTLYGTTVAYDEQDYGILKEERDNEGTYFDYTPFEPSMLEGIAGDLTKEAFIRMLERLVAGHERRDPKPQREMAMGGPTKDKGKALRNTTALVDKIKKALGKKQP